MRKKQQWLRVAATVLSMLVLTACTGNTLSFDNNLVTESLLSGPSDTLENTDSAYKYVCENENYQLLCRGDVGAFQVVNKANPSEIWQSVVTQDLYDLERSTALWRAYMQSIVSITYVSKTDTRGTFLQSHSASDENTTQVTTYPQGVRVEVFFAQASIKLALEIVLTSNGIEARLPAEAIEEQGDYYLLAVDVLPFFEAAAATEDGYIFMPDGCGTLMEFSQTNKKNDFANSVELDVYGELDQSDLFNEEIPQVFFPVYGIKRAEKALFANVTQGDSYTRIIVNPAVKMAAVKLNRANLQFIYRHQYRIYLSNIVQNGQNVSSSLYGTKCESEMLMIDRVIHYSFLQSDEADYSGMAVAYRKYLMESGRLTKNTQSVLPLALKFFMGDELAQGLYNKMMVTTTYEDIKNIIAAYQEAGIENLEIILQGWSKHGQSAAPQVYQASGAFGGANALGALDKFLAESDSVNAYLELNVTDATAGVTGFSEKKDVITSASSIPVTDANRSRFLLKPLIVTEQMKRAQKLLDKYQTFGAAMQTIGYQLYQDMSKDGSCNRWQTAQQWQALLGDVSQKHRVALSGIATYSMAYTDYAYDLPLTSSMNALADRDIPWVSMVLYGSVTMSSRAGNMCSDSKEMLLKWVEYGSAPTYVLTEENPNILRDTQYNVLFSSRNDLWKKRIIETYQSMSGRLAPVLGTTIVRHEYAAEQVVLIAYENGYYVGINYSDTPVEVHGQTIPAVDYLVWEGAVA